MSQTPAEYEFSAEQSVVFTKLSDHMKSVGFWFQIYGAMQIIGFLLKLIFSRYNSERFDFDFGGLLSGLFFLYLGLFTRRGGWEFRKVSDTQGHDISHLLQALGEVSRFYGILHFVIRLVVILLVVVLILVAIAAINNPGAVTVKLN
jgi:hypothetical protein